MKLLRTVAALVALSFVSPALAQWQTPNHSIPVGRGAGMTGFGNAAPGTSGLPLKSNGPAVDPSFGPITNNGIAPGPANTVKGTVDGVATSDLAIASCSAVYQFTQWVTGTGWQCGFTPVLPSRAVAATLNLSAFSAVRTLGYYTPGDGGAATFQNVGSAAFTDTYIATASVAGGSGYVNGSYVDVRFVGGTGKFCSVGATVAGGLVATVSSVSPCNGYSVGDVLTAPNSVLGGSGSGFTYTVTSIGGPGASFTSVGGTHWQYVPDGVPNAKQFGCKPDWNGNDATAFNNSPCLWSALAYVGGINGSTIGVAGFGGQLLVPKGAYMTCGAWNNTPYNFVVPQAVRFTGESIFGTTLKECTADPGNTYYIELCDPNVAGGQFGCKVEYMTLYGFTLPAASAGTAMIHSQSGQQYALAEEVEVDAGKRGCVKYEVGIGGASNDVWIGVNCVQSGTATNPGFSFNANTSQHIMDRSLCGSGPAGAAICIQNLSGRLIARDIDIEGYVIGLQQNVTISGLISSYKNIQEQAASCTAAIQLVNGNIPNNLIIENLSTGCPVTVQNNQPGGVNWASNVRGPMMCPGGACTAAIP